jgi:methionine sulfoxide reductase catalytic subunit
MPLPSRPWALPAAAVTPESLFMNRRSLLQAMGSLPLLTAGASLLAPGHALAAGYPYPRSTAYPPERVETPENLATTYNNFYEFGTSKSVASAAQALKPSPWAVVLDGMVEKPLTFDAEELIARMPLEERVYRLRCVEAWSAVIPWTGFPLAALVKLAQPTAAAKYVRFETFLDSSMAPGQRQFWQPWPYVEGVTIAEATNDLAFIATGAYGKPLPKQMGAPIRLVLPWKYGFKSIKSIVKVTFTDKRPVSYWEQLQASEYGFWANVNPEVSHPRWSQASERTLTGERIPTRLFNGYGAWVADLYKGLETEKLYM